MNTNTIFFSYSRDNSEFVLELAKKLREAGAKVWLDQLDIQPGTRWDKSIETALASSSTLLVILSKSSVASHNVMDEVSYALEEGKTVVPILFEECEIPFRLRRLQFADFTKSHKTGIATLTKALKLDAQVTSKLVVDAEDAGPSATPPVEQTKAAPVIENEGSAASDYVAAKSKDPLANSGGRKKIIYAVTALLVAVIVLFATGLLSFEDATDDFPTNMVEFAATDDDAWSNAKIMNTYKAYLDYIVKYSDDGKYLDEASTKMDELANAEGVVQYSEVSEGNKENYFEIYKAGISDVSNTPTAGQYIISLTKNDVMSSLIGAKNKSGTIIEDQVAKVIEVQTAAGKVWCRISFHK